MFGHGNSSTFPSSTLPYLYQISILIEFFFSKRIIKCGSLTLKGIQDEGAIKHGQSRETGNIGYTRRRKTKQKHNTIYVGHHFAQTNTNNEFYRTWLYIWVTRWVSYKKQWLLTLREFTPVFWCGPCCSFRKQLCCRKQTQIT
jgi:hypothetical protein